jgi:hypothetical protein
MTKGHNKGKNHEENAEAKDTNSPGQNRHLKKGNRDSSPAGRNAESDPSKGRKKKNNV